MFEDYELIFSRSTKPSSWSEDFFDEFQHTFDVSLKENVGCVYLICNKHSNGIEIVTELRSDSGADFDVYGELAFTDYDEFESFLRDGPIKLELEEELNKV